MLKVVKDMRILTSSLNLFESHYRQRLAQNSARAIKHGRIGPELVYQDAYSFDSTERPICCILASRVSRLEDKEIQEEEYF